MKIGICGAGSFAKAFVPLFSAHPLVDELVIADLVPERAQELAAQNAVQRVCFSMDELLMTDIDCVAVFAQRHLHGPLSIQALQAGKNVYCAVPMASSLEDMMRIIGLVEKTGLVYMNGETSYYYPSALYCRERFAKGDFGRFVYGEGNYYHDMSHGFYAAFQHSGGKDWRKVAGFPPMFYPTHSTSLVLSVTGSRATQVSCMGCVDREDDGVFGAGNNQWDNPYSNQTALMRTADGGMMRVNEFRRIGWHGKVSSNPLCLYGTKGSFEQNSDSALWADLSTDGNRNLHDLLDCYRHYQGHHGDATEELHEVLVRDFNSQFAVVHPKERLPKAFVGLRNGHLGSHQFLVDDFVKSCAQKALPPINAWEAAKYCAPGLVAHESCLQGGALLDIPDFGVPPADWKRTDLRSEG